MNANAPKEKSDAVDHPRHYTSHPSGVECITITKHMNFNLGNVFKYIWRADRKGAHLEDLRKARFYLDCEIEMLEARSKVVVTAFDIAESRP